MSVEHPYGLLIVPDIHVVDVSGFRTDEEKEWVEMIPQDSLYFAFNCPAFGAL